MPQTQADQHLLLLQVSAVFQLVSSRKHKAEILAERSNAGWLIEHHLARFIVGQDPRSINKMNDQMHRACVPTTLILYQLTSFRQIHVLWSQRLARRCYQCC